MRFHVNLLFDEGDLIVSPIGRCATHFGQTPFSEPVSQPKPRSANGTPVFGRWQPHPFGQNRPFGVPAG
jgi:hypothetical protein